MRPSWSASCPPCRCSPKTQRLERLDAEVRRLRREVAARYPLEEQEIWDRACRQVVEFEMPLEAAVHEELEVEARAQEVEAWPRLLEATSPQ